MSIEYNCSESCDSLYLPSPVRAIKIGQGSKAQGVEAGEIGHSLPMMFEPVSTEINASCSIQTGRAGLVK
jgi:hypothetical protein